MGLLMKHLSHNELVAAANDLGPLPRSFTRLSAIFADEEYSLAEVVGVIETDGALAGRVFRAANSPLYGGDSVGSVRGAIARIGTATILSMAMMNSLRPKWDIDLTCFGLTTESYWNHSVAVLCFAEQIAQEFPHLSASELTTSALLHDFGKLVMAPYVSQDHIAALRECDGVLSIVDAEMQVFGLNHAEVAAVVAQRWALPESIVRAVQYHHTPSMQSESLGHALNLANQLAWRFLDQNDDYERESGPRASSLDSLGLSVEMLESIYSRGCEHFEVTLKLYS